MKPKVLKPLLLLLTAQVGGVAFCSCSSSCDDCDWLVVTQACEHSISGIVENSRGIPVENIRVTAENQKEVIYKTRTSATGLYHFSYEYFTEYDHADRYELTFEDTDGEENGGYNQSYYKTIKINNCNRGTVANIKLKDHEPQGD